jgi:hypothetical protein
MWARCPRRGDPLVGPCWERFACAVVRLRASLYPQITVLLRKVRKRIKSFFVIVHPFQKVEIPVDLQLACHGALDRPALFFLICGRRAYTNEQQLELLHVRREFWHRVWCNITS